MAILALKVYLVFNIVFNVLHELFLFNVYMMPIIQVSLLSYFTFDKKG